jgi:colanic acid/amylovoran biosynthesis glycosyltransferase
VQSSPPQRDRLKLAYLVARFPKTTETFVARELNEVARDPGIDAHLFSLFPAPDAATVHPSAEPWMSRLRTVPPQAALRATFRWLRRRPLRTVTTLSALLWGFRQRPGLLPASIASFVIGCAHAETLDREGFNHVHAHFVGNPGTAAWTIHRLTGIGYSATVHAYELFQDKAFLCRRVIDARFVVTISDFNARWLRAECTGAGTPIHVIHAGVDLQRFGFTDRGEISETVNAVTVGSLMPHKGHRVLLEALADPELADIRLSIIGDGDERPALARQALSLGLQERISFLGNLPEDRVAAELEHSDLFVSPSLIGPTGRMEGVPVVLMEALAAGVPAIATRLSGVPELIRDGETGLLSEQGDVESLRAMLRLFLADRQAAASRARAGRQLVEQEFDVAQSGRSLVGLFLAERARTDDGGRPAFVAWSRSDRAPELAAAVGADAHVVFFPSMVSRGLVPLRYIASAILTTLFLLRRRPPTIVTTNPPIFPALLAFLLGRLWGAELVLDSHPRGFGLKGSVVGKFFSPLHHFLIRRARATIVASPTLVEVVRRHGGRPLVVHEAPPKWQIDSLAELDGRPTVLWVTIFASDEPIPDVLEAARRLPECDFLITGDIRRCPEDLYRSAPSNVTFTGFWPAEGFRNLIESAHVLLVLTTEPASVPRAAFEAVEARRPLVLSRWPGLAELFPGAALVDNDPDDIVRGIRVVLDDLSALNARAGTLREDQRMRWRSQRAQLMGVLTPQASSDDHDLAL